MDEEAFTRFSLHYKTESEANIYRKIKNRKAAVLFLLRILYISNVCTNEAGKKVTRQHEHRSY